MVINGRSNKNFENKILKINDQLEIFYSKYVPIDIEKFKNKKVIAFAGIGNPENFLIYLKKMN